MNDDDQPLRSTVRGMHHVAMTVRDLDASLDFYERTTGMERLAVPAVTGPLPQRPERMAVMAAPNGRLQLMQFSGDAAPVMPVEGPGPTHVCFQSPEPRGLFGRFTEAGARAVSTGEPPIDMNGRGVRYGYARDPDGIMFEVEQLEAPRFEGPIWLAHLALASPDIDRAVAFYTTLLGVEPYGRVNKVTGPRVDEVTGLENVRIRAAWFNTGNMILELWQFIEPVTPEPGAPAPFDRPGYGKFALEVGDLRGEVRRLSREGLTFLGDPVEADGVTELYARDPDGNLFSLLEAGPEAVARVDDLQRIDWLPSPAAPGVEPH